jgi:hypothetical protein
MNPGSSRRQPDLFIPVLLLVLVFLLAARTPLDTDLYWHLAAGKQTWQTAQPLTVDVFSFTRAGQTWINHSWLSQVILYGLYQLGGNLALAAWVATLAAISMGLVYAQMRGPAIFRAFLIVLACTVAAVVWSPRPQLMSLVLFALLGWILYRYKWRKINQLWLLPLVFWGWSNLHGGWALGFMLVGLLVGGETLNHILGNHSDEVLNWREIGQVLLWGGLSVPVLALHPNGLEILKIPFQTVEVQVLQQFIQEWASPDFHELFQQPYLWLLLGVLAAFGLSGRKVDGFDLLVVVWFGGLGLVARRNFGPFALAATPVLARYLWAAIRSWRDAGWAEPGGWGAGPEEPAPLRRRPRGLQILNLILVGLFGLIGLVKLWAVTYPTFIDSASAQMNPAGAVQYLAGHQATGRLFNEYNWGGYLVWTYPQTPVFVDGRTDLYGDEIIGEWIQIIQADSDWAERLAKWKVDWVLIEPTRPLASVLTSAGWTVAYRDDHSVLFTK